MHLVQSMSVIIPLKSKTFLLYPLLLPGLYKIALIPIALSRDVFISQRQKHSSTIVIIWETGEHTLE